MLDDEKPRAVARATSAFVLRWVEAARGIASGDLIDIFIITTIMMGNIGRLRTNEYHTLEDIPPDAERRPLTSMQIAQSMDLPYETVRRRVVKLEADGWCERVDGGGYIIPQRVFEQDNMLQALMATHLATQRLLRELKALGALPG